MNIEHRTLNLEGRTGQPLAHCPSPHAVGRGGLVSSCPFGAAVCADLPRRESGLCLECWAGVLERVNAHSEWLK